MHTSNILSTYYGALCEGLSTVSIVCIIILSTNDKSYYNWLQDQIAPASKTLQFYKIDEEKSRLKDIRIMCLVMTHPGNHKTKALQVMSTWGKRCTFLKFLTTEEDDKLPTFVSDSKEEYMSIWGKTKYGFYKTYTDYEDKVDWVIKADDDTFIVMENLKFLLSSYNHTDPIWFGCEFKVIVKDGYMSGGAGYVLSKESLRRFYEALVTNNTNCKVDDDKGMEDVEMGKCLKAVGVRNEDSRDNHGRYRFLPLTPTDHIQSRKWKNPSFWMWSYYKHDQMQDLNCCSNLAISFHYISPDMMILLEYLIYHLHPFGYKFEDNDEIPTSNRRKNNTEAITYKYSSMQ